MPDGADSATPTTSDVERITKQGQALTAALGEVVAILMRDPRFRHMSLGDLEWAVAPALVSSQFLLMRGALRPKESPAGTAAEGPTIPIGVALWANVSDEVSEKLAKQRADGVGYRLAPREWTSGDKIWLLAMVAPGPAMEALRKRLEDEVFRDRSFEVYRGAGS